MSPSVYLREIRKPRLGVSIVSIGSLPQGNQTADIKASDFTAEVYLREIGRETTALANACIGISQVYLREIGRETTAVDNGEPFPLIVYLREIGRETTAPENG